jgi:hypothetical protein
MTFIASARGVVAMMYGKGLDKFIAAGGVVAA